MEIAKQDPQIVTVGHSCPMWVPLVEYGEGSRPGADYFVKQEIDTLIDADSEIDTVILACTHYPILLPKIKQFLPEEKKILCQGGIVADSLADYLLRHPEMERRLSKGGITEFRTTENAERFSSMASLFLHTSVHASTVTF